MTSCLVCREPVEPFFDFGKMPLGNGFLRPDQFAEEFFFRMLVGFCEACGMVQLLAQPDRERMFHEQYPFFSGSSKLMARHFEEFARQVTKNHLQGPDPFVVEFGCNDGILLQHFAETGVRCLGIEPAKNVARIAAEKGIETLNDFFGADLARTIAGEHGRADAIIAANVMCHIPYVHSILEGVKALLGPNGVFVFEDPYLGDVLEKTSYDQLYDEHVFLFSVTSVHRLCGMHGMEVTDVIPQTTHGGSMRYVIAFQGAKAINDRVGERLAKEQVMGMHHRVTYEKFRTSCEHSRIGLLEALSTAKSQGKRVVGYGATSKSTTVLNYCGIHAELVPFICDTTPIKQGKFSPGVHIPIRPHEAFTAEYPDFALLLAWNHAREIMDKEGGFRARGGKWIVYVPQVGIL